MPVLCRPAVAVPEHVITQEETLDLARTLHADHASLPLVLRLIRNTGVARRHLVQPIEQTLAHPGFEARNTRYEADYCAGAQLARMEAEVMLGALLARLPGLALAVPPERIAWRTGTVNRGPETLPVTW